jgi:Amt family ammonium transporter
MFAAITPCIAFGSAAERTTLTAYIFFLFIWSTIVYDFIAYWNWAANGWLHNFGVLDFAGGTPVHINSGFSALA